MAWAVTVTGPGLKGTGAVLAPRLVLTASHVVRDAKTVEVATEAAAPSSFSVIDRSEERDLALLEPVDEDLRLPEDLVAVPRAYRRGARPAGDRALLQLSITGADLPSSVEVELRPSPASAGHVEFVVPGAREGVKHGYSGAAVVELNAGSSRPRLLGIVRARDSDSVDTLDHAGTGWLVPMERIAECFAQVGALVETPIERSPEWTAHWQPRSRGVATSSEPGHFFSGRQAACAAVRRHLQQDAGLAVVTGSRGRGKSAVLAHVLVSSCPRYLTLLEATDPAARARLAQDGLEAPVDGALLARTTTAELAAELARQLGFEPCGPQELVDRVGRERPGCRIVIDAVDESPDPDALMRTLVVPLSQHAAVAIGALARHVEWQAPSSTTWIDLDDAEYGDDAIPAYVSQRLRERGAYAEPAASRVASAVAKRAAGNFLVAWLVSRALAAGDPIDTSEAGWQELLPADLTDAFRDYVGRLGTKAEQRRVLALLAPLAYARGEGLTLPAPGLRSVWLETANRLRPDTLGAFVDQDLRDACERAGDLIVGQEGGPRRLYHEGLAEAVRGLTSRDADAASQGFTRTLTELLPAERDARADAYDALDPYLLHHLPTHLEEQGRAAALLERPGLLLAGDSESLRSALVRGALTVPGPHEAARVAVVHSLARYHPSRRERAGALCAALGRQGELERAHAVREALSPASLAYELLSGPQLAPVLATIENAHSQGFGALAVVEHGGAAVVVSAGYDGAIRSWRLDGGAGPLAVERHVGSIGALAVVEHEGAAVVVSAGLEEIRSWRLDGGAGPLAVERAHGGIGALAAVEHDGAPVIVSAGYDGAIRSWRLDCGTGPLAVERAHVGGIRALAAVEHDGAPVIVSAGYDGAICSWRLDCGAGPLAVERAHVGPIGALAVVEHEGAAVIVSAGYDGAIRSWRLDGGAGPLAVEDAHDPSILALAVVEHEGAAVVVSAGLEEIRSWRLDGGTGPLAVERAHVGGIGALAAVEHDGAAVVVSAGYDGAIRSWRLDGGTRPLAGEQPHGGIAALAVVEHEGAAVVVSAGYDGAIRSWRPDGGAGPLAVERAHVGPIGALVVVEHDGAAVVVIGGGDGAIRSWRLDGGTGPLAVDQPHRRGIWALAAVEHDGAPVVVSADHEEIRSWRLDGGAGLLAVERAHVGPIAALAAVEHDGAAVVVSGGGDGAIRSRRLDGGTGPLVVELAHFGPIWALAVVEHGGAAVVVSGGGDGAICSWRLDGGAGPLAVERAHVGPIGALAAVEHDGAAVVVSGGGDGAIRSWRLDGGPGPLAVGRAHVGGIRALAVVDHDGAAVVVSAGYDGAILLHSGASTRSDNA